jgi:hypothetical protein
MKLTWNMKAQFSANYFALIVKMLFDMESALNRIKRARRNV